jgi:hypothetical protein
MRRIPLLTTILTSISIWLASCCGPIKTDVYGGGGKNAAGGVRATSYFTQEGDFEVGLTADVSGINVDSDTDQATISPQLSARYVGWGLVHPYLLAGPSIIYTDGAYDHSSDPGVDLRVGVEAPLPDDSPFSVLLEVRALYRDIELSERSTGEPQRIGRAYGYGGRVQQFIRQTRAPGAPSLESQREIDGWDVQVLLGVGYQW